MREVMAAVRELLDGHPHLQTVERADEIDIALRETVAPVFDGDPQPRPDWYAVLTLSSPNPRNRRASGDAPVGLYRLGTKYVGQTPDEARAIGEWIQDRLELSRLDIPGRRCGAITLGSPGLGPTPDTEINPSLFALSDLWGFHLTT